jgi:hypothetical protein
VQGDEDATEELKEVSGVVQQFKRHVMSYMAHRLRAVQQDCARELHFLDAPAGTAFIMLDYMAKWTPMWHKCAICLFRAIDHNLHFNGICMAA